MLDNDGMEELLNGVDSENTKKQIRYAVTRLEQFEKVVNEKAPVENAVKLDTFLGRFYSSLRQKNGNLY